MSVIVVQFVTLDGIIGDPTGSDGTPAGGWALRHGRAAIGGDRFGLGSTLDDGVLLLGRTTWQIFAGIWPHRDDPFAVRVNAASKLVASRTLTDASAWVNSQIIDGDLVDTVKRERRDVIVMGSPSVTHALMAEDLVDEYRLLVFPTVVGSGERLFPEGMPPAYLDLCSSEASEATVLNRYERPSR